MGRTFINRKKYIMSEIMLELATKTGYALTESTWEATKAEIHRIKELIESNKELDPSDVKEVTSLAKKVNDLGENYKKAINKTATDYKNYLAKLLTDEGYDVITAFIDEKKRLQKLEVSNRINEKATQYREIVNSELTSHPLVASTPLKDVVYNAFLTRFPNINSGDKTKVIKDWNAVRMVIKSHLDNVEKALTDYPVICQLPVGSHSMMALTEYLKTSAEYGIHNLNVILQQDRSLIEQLVLRQKVSSADDAITLIDQVIHSESTSEEKLSQIQQVITAHSANKVM